MKNQHSPIILICSLYLICIGQICLAQNPEAYSDQAFEVLTEIFDYDKHEPLEAEVVQKLNFGVYTREKIVFSGNRNSCLHDNETTRKITTDKTFFYILFSAIVFSDLLAFSVV